ncbi:BrnT family toxin [soil metagenome]
MTDSFDWDPLKNLANIEKHGISFEEARWVFNDIKAMEFPDEDHSWDENRWIALGRLPDGSIILVVFVERGEKTRIISARTATKSEAKDYDERS